jgi:hypothetical protein
MFNFGSQESPPGLLFPPPVLLLTPDCLRVKQEYFNAQNRLTAFMIK